MYPTTAVSPLRPRSLYRSLVWPVVLISACGRAPSKEHDPAVDQGTVSVDLGSLDEDAAAGSDGPPRVSGPAGQPCVQRTAAGPRYIDGCRGEAPVFGDFVVANAIDAAALCQRGDWVVGELRVLPSAAGRQGLACLRGVEGHLRVELDAASGATGLEGLDGLVRANSLEIVGEADLEVRLLAGLLSADSLSLALDGAEAVQLAPQLAALGALHIDSPALQQLGPAWPLEALDGLRVEAAPVPLELEALAGLRRVEGDVRIARLNRDALGLDALEEVGGDLRLTGVRADTEASLAQLVRVGGTLALAWTADTSTQLPRLEEAGGLELRLTNNRRLPFSWTGFGSLRAVHGDLSLHSTKLDAVAGFDVLDDVAGDLRLSADASPTGGWLLSGMPALRAVGGDLATQRLSTSAPLFTALEVVEGTLELWDSAGLATLPALAELGWLEHARRSADLALPALQVLVGDLDPDAVRTLDFGVLEQIGGALRVQSGDRLPTGLAQLTEAGAVEIDAALEGPFALPALEQVEGELRLSSAQSVSSLDLSALRTVGGALRLQRLGLDGALSLPALRTVGADLELSNAGLLTTLELPSMERIDGALTLQRLTRLHTVGGLDALSALGGLRLAEAPRMTDLPSMPALVQLDGDLVLDQNLRLGRLGGLGALRVLNGAARITDNPWLRSAEINALLNQLNGPPTGGLSLSGNAP